MIGPTRDDQQHHRDGRAEPDPAGLAEMLFVTSTDSSSSPLMPRLMMYTRSNARSDSMMVMTRTTMLMGLRTGNTTRKNSLALVGAVDLGGLPEAGVEGLEPRQVEDHHVPDLAPARRDQHGPQVEALVAQPVDDVPCVVGAQDAVDEALGRRVLQLPDEADDGQRQHDRQVQRALVEAAAADVLVEEDREEDAQRRGDQQEPGEPDEVVLVKAGQNGL